MVTMYYTHNCSTIYMHCKKYYLYICSVLCGIYYIFSLLPIEIFAEDLKNSQMELYNRILSLEPDNSVYRLQRALLYYQQGSLQKARDDAQFVLQNDEYQEYAYTYLGLINHTLANYSVAIQLYSEALKNNAQFFDAYYYRGQAYYDEGNFELASYDFLQAVHIDAESINAYIWAGKSFYHSTYYNDAIRSFTTALTLDDDNPIIYFNRANAYQANNQCSAAIVDYTKALALQTNYVPALTNRGICYFLKKEYAKARQDFSYSIYLDPSRANAYYHRALIYYQQENYVNSVRDIEQALRIMPEHYASYLLLGNIFMRSEHLQEAIIAYNKALQLNPYSNNAAIYHGIIQDEYAQYDKAISEYNKAIARDTSKTSVAIAYNNRGFLYLKKALAYPSKERALRLVNLAIEDFLTANEKNPNLQEPELGLQISQNFRINIINNTIQGAAYNQYFNETTRVYSDLDETDGGYMTQPFVTKPPPLPQFPHIETQKPPVFSPLIPQLKQ